MHRNQVMRRCAVAAVVALAGTVAVAEDWDPTGQAGEYAEATAATVVRGTGGSFDTVTVYCPWIIDPTPLINAAAVETVGGNPVGAVGTGGTSSNLNVVAILGTQDVGGFSNNIIIDDAVAAASNPLGTLLGDGTLLWREAFAGTAQNNLGYQTGITGILPQIPFPEPSVAPNKVFGAFPGVDATAGASVFTGTPAAARNPVGGGLLSGMTAFSFDGGIITGVGVWEDSANNPNVTYDQWLTGAWTIDAEPANVLRTSQPVMANVTPQAGARGVDDTYIAWGLGASGATNFSGGSAEPRILLIDRVGDNDSYLDAAYIRADGGSGALALANGDFGAIDPTKAFLDHSATGGGSGPFVNSLFDINSSGQIACIWEDSSVSPHITQIRRYDPIWSGGRIVDYSAPIIILEAGQDGTVEELVNSDGLGTITHFVPVSGCSIDSHGNVAFVAVTDADIDETDPLNPMLVSSTNTLFYWTHDSYLGAGDEALHAVVAGGQNGITLGALNAGADLQVGFFPVDPQGNGDTFSREGLSEDGQYLAVNSRGASAFGTDNPDLDGGVLLDGGGEISVDHTLIVDLGQFTVAPTGCAGDANGDGVVDVNDISFVLFRLGQNNGVCGDGDANGDGVNDVNDISYVLFRLGTCNPGGPC